LKHLITISS